MSPTTPDITIPSELLPADGRFCCGPSKVRPEAVAALAAEAADYLGTSHRKDGVRFMVSRLRNGLAELFALPDGYEIMLGNGGTTVFWDAATFGLIGQRSQHLVFGEFSSKFAVAAAAAPHLEDPTLVEAEPGTRPEALAEVGIDLYALTHNETSTGVAMPLMRPDGVSADDALVAVDATSAAGGMRWDPTQVDVYYFAPQKCLASDGGLWLAALSPAAVERIERIAASDRWVPASLDLGIALEQFTQGPDLQHAGAGHGVPRRAAGRVVVSQRRAGVGASRCDRSSWIMYDWAEASDYATPFVADPADRSTVVTTIDLDEAVDATTVSSVLRANGVLDTESYRKLGRNQLRVATFPAIDPADVEALTNSIDHVVQALS